MDFLTDIGMVKNDNQGQVPLSHFTGISTTDFINTDTFCKRLHEHFHPGEIFFNHVPKASDQEPYTFAETKELIQQLKKAVKELSKNKKQT